MKRILTLALGALACMAAVAQPILVGHRGSNYGVENSEESFKNGVKLGYQYLETDVKFTKDNVLVCSHDDNTRRLGGTLDLATSTLEELQSETLTQTRLGETYTGRLCSMKEYLQICKDAGIGAVIELKWTAGINSNDCSKIPLLIAQIDAMDMRRRVIILTSMKPCLEYIRTNYPDIELQFLTGEKWAQNFDWCVKWKIDADIQAGYFDRATVKQFHAQGLKVNMWTTNDEAGYLNYGNMGCDFITTDRLDGHNLPALSPEVTSPVNETDYPETAFNPVLFERYTLGEAKRAEWPTAFEGHTIRKAVRANAGWYVLGMNSEEESQLFFWADGKAPVEMDMYGADDLTDIALSVEGMLLGTSLAPAANWRLMAWGSPEAEAEEILNLEDFEDIAEIEIGEAMAVSGRVNNMLIYTTVPAEGQLCVIRVDKGIITAADCLPFPDAFGRKGAAEGSLKMSPMSRNEVIMTVDGESCAYRIEDGKLNAVEDFPALPAATRAFDWLRYGSQLYTAAAVASDSGMLTAVVTDAEGEAVTMQRTLGVTPTGFVATDFRAIAQGDSPLSVFVEGQGVYTLAFDPEAAPQEPSQYKLVLERYWIYSNTTDNFLEQFDGMYARQGTAVNHRFYINNSNERKLHVFDCTGHLGSLPGGEGYGCCRDDAGNIIVRTDATAGPEHSFLVYPAGVLPDSEGVNPVEFSIDCRLEGQTDFINASGDVLSAAGGYIYLYPAKQLAVALIKVVNGECAGVTVADGLAIEGSAAGYVVPDNNNPYHWYYQVRSSAPREYIGGVSVDLMSGRSSTTAPARNTTGGMAVINEGGNRILVHNSGANYMGGFTVRDLTLDKVIATVDPIGTKAYNDGNYSTFNWLIAERNNDFDYTIYQYCPANGIAEYRLARSGSVTDVATDAPSLISYDGTTITAAGGAQIIVSDLAGRVVATASGALRTADLPRGVLIVRAAGAAVKILNR